VLQAIQPVLAGVGTAIGGVVDWIRQLLDFIARAIDAVGRFLDSLNPLKGVSLPNISLPFAAPAPELAAGTRASTRGASSGTINIHVYGGDPRRTTQAVRESFRRWRLTDGSTAPDRDW
jgi:hypothetical protein